jgi:imidazole glycerol-phosphate synthase subunit HisH
VIAIVDYGVGNVAAIGNIYKRLDIPAKLAATAEELDEADRVVLPGVGSFDWAMERLDRSGLRPALERAALEERKPILGICVGMQMLARGSDEGRLPGFGWIDGHVRRFEAQRGGRRTQLPHMGWNDVEPADSADLFADWVDDARFYFLHSYYFEAADPANVLAVTDYNGRFASAVRARNILGVQFHPEKSHQWGVQLLKNFAAL